MQGMSIGISDIILIAIMAVFGISGYKNGFLKMCFRCVSFIAAIILAKFLYPYLAGFIKTTDIYTGLVKNITEIISGKDNGSVLTAFLNSIGNTAQTEAGIYISQFVINILSFIAVIIVVKIILMIIEKILHIFSKLPVVSFINKASGMILGLAEGAVIICIVLAIIFAFSPLRENKNINDFVSRPGITNKIYENNPLVKLVLPKQ